MYLVVDQSFFFFSCLAILVGATVCRGVIIFYLFLHCYTHTHICMCGKLKFSSPNFIFKLALEQVPIPLCYSSPWPLSAAGKISGEPQISPHHQIQLILACPRGKNCFTFLLFFCLESESMFPFFLGFNFLYAPAACLLLVLFFPFL